MDSFLRRIDGFQSLPKELTETSHYGGTYTVISILVLGFLFFSEFMSFMTAHENTYIVMNQGDAKSLEIIFDVTMLALPCDHVDIMLFDAFRESALPVHASTLTRTPIVDGVLETSKATTVTKSKTPKNGDGTVGPHTNHPELDQDWDSSSKIMKSHITFDSVIKAHDFTFINFYADWCVHCRNFAPIWNEAEKAADLIVYKDADGKNLQVKMIRINCVEFAEECQKIHIPYFPNLRLYKSDTHYEIYEGERVKTALLEHLKTQAGQSHHPSMSEKSTETIRRIDSCRLSGSLTTLRVPGEFHFQVKSHDRSLVASMTNVSHTIDKLVFADDPEAKWNEINKNLPKEVQQNANPLGQQSFISKSPHLSPQHHIQVVTTRINDQIIYQLTTQSHTKPEDRTAIPQAKFSYTISPMTVVITKKYTPFYKFLTSICALLGGAFTMIKFLHSTTDYVVKRRKGNLGKLG